MRRPTNLIRVNKETKEELDSRKIHPNQSYNEVIQESLEISGVVLKKLNKEEIKEKG